MIRDSAVMIKWPITVRLRFSNIKRIFTVRYFSFILLLTMDFKTEVNKILYFNSQMF